MNRVAVLILLLPLIGACQTTRLPTQTTVTGQLDRVCTVWKQITYDALLDTEQTKAEVKANNRRNAAYGCVKGQ